MRGRRRNEGDDDATTEPRARAQIEGYAPKTQAQKVNRVLAMMVAKRWKRGESAEELASEWGCTKHAVEQVACEAKHLLEIIGEPETVLQTASAELLRISLESGNDRVPALRVMLEATGQLRQKVEVQYDLKSRPEREIFEAAFTHPGFREWLRERLLAEGWIEPVRQLTEATDDESN